MEELVRYARAIMLIQLYQSQRISQMGDGPILRAELLLSDAGFSAKEIALFLNKSPGATAKAISRARAAEKRELTFNAEPNGGDDNA